MKRKTVGYIFLLCWVGMTALIAVNRWDTPISEWLAVTFIIAGIGSGYTWLWEGME